LHPIYIMISFYPRISQNTGYNATASGWAGRAMNFLVR